MINESWANNIALLLQALRLIVQITDCNSNNFDRSCDLLSVGVFENAAKIAINILLPTDDLIQTVTCAKH